MLLFSVLSLCSRRNTQGYSGHVPQLQPGLSWGCKKHQLWHLEGLRPSSRPGRGFCKAVFLTFTLFSSLLSACAAFCPSFLKMFSQRHHQHGCRAWPCPVVGWLELAGTCCAWLGAAPAAHSGCCPAAPANTWARTTSAAPVCLPPALLFLLPFPCTFPCRLR